jgi:hypothetical protein
VNGNHHDGLSKLSTLDRESNEGNQYDMQRTESEFSDVSQSRTNNTTINNSKLLPETYKKSKLVTDDSELVYDDDEYEVDEEPFEDETDQPTRTLTKTKSAFYQPGTGMGTVPVSREDDYDDYADDFEADHSVTLAATIAKPLTAASAQSKAVPLLPPTVSVPPTARSTPPVPSPRELEGLTAVEQIMQRWSNTDSNNIAMDLIGRTMTNDEDNELRQGRLPGVPESPLVSSATRKTSSVLWPDVLKPVMLYVVLTMVLVLIMCGCFVD